MFELYGYRVRLVLLLPAFRHGFYTYVKDKVSVIVHATLPAFVQRLNQEGVSEFFLYIRVITVVIFDYGGFCICL